MPRIDPTTGPRLMSRPEFAAKVARAVDDPAPREQDAGEVTNEDRARTDEVRARFWERQG